MTEQRTARIFEHPLAFGSLRVWLGLLIENRHVDRKFLPRALVVTLSTLATSPLRIYESLRYRKAVERTEIHAAPIFIIGHWRSGTTHLHNLLAQDENFGYVSTFQAFAPGLAIVGDRWLKPAVDWVAKKFHPTREVDNIPLSMDNPEEEDLAIANLSPWSYLHMYTFPRRAQFYFERYVTNFESLPKPIITKWKQAYLSVLRKASLHAEGKRLVIKNCADSARISTLLELFPNAKFIHICRNPYDIFRSTEHLYRVVLGRAQLQEVPPGTAEEWVMRFYPQLMQRLLADKALIPADNLVELRYEELVADPVAQLRKVYETLDLPDFVKAEPRFRAYLSSIAGYQRNEYQMDAGMIAKLNEHWSFAFEALGYEQIEASRASDPTGKRGR